MLELAHAETRGARETLLGADRHSAGKGCAKRAQPRAGGGRLRSSQRGTTSPRGLDAPFGIRATTHFAGPARWNGGLIADWRSGLDSCRRTCKTFAAGVETERWLVLDR